MKTVLKPFNTRLSRYRPGDALPEDADLSPHSIEGLTAAGYLAGAPAPRNARSEPRPAPASEPDLDAKGE